MSLVEENHVGARTTSRSFLSLVQPLRNREQVLAPTLNLFQEIFLEFI